VLRVLQKLMPGENYVLVVVDFVEVEVDVDVVTVPDARLLLLLPEATKAMPAATKPRPTTHHTVLSLS
jgi:hypothetical protein